jgi:hypothetical protein
MPVPQNRLFKKTPKIIMTANGYEISGDHKSGKLLSITQDGLIKIY